MHRSEILFCLRGVRGAGTGSADRQSGGGRRQPHGKDHLSGRLARYERPRHPRSPAIVQGGAEGAGGQPGALEKSAWAQVQRQLHLRTGADRPPGIRAYLYRRAAAGIGSNLYLAKIAMDIEAKHIPAGQDGVRIAQLDELSYREKLWQHRPLTDFWRIGRGYRDKLEANGMFTMGDVARCSLYNEDKLYKLFGVNAELLIDHAWGWEPCTMPQVKAYRPATNSISSGQVLSCGYSYEKTRLIVREMTELLALDLVEKNLVTDQLTLTIGYDVENLTNSTISQGYTGEISTDFYGRKVPKNAHGTANLKWQTSSTRLIMEAMLELYECIIDPDLLVRRLWVVANHLIDANAVVVKAKPEQLELFRDYAAEQRRQAEEEATLAREKKMQQAMVDIKKKFGKNAILKGVNLVEGATTLQRNEQIGGHKA